VVSAKNPYGRILGFLDLFAKHNYNDPVKEDEIGGPCSMNGGEEECI
jgi:hypothetical protein